MTQVNIVCTNYTYSSVPTCRGICNTKPIISDITVLCDV